MNNIPTFSNIECFSFLIEDNDYFQEYTNLDLPYYLEANFINLKYSPTLREFAIIEEIHKDRQENHNLNYLNIYWPANQGIFPDVRDYLDEQYYQIGMNSLYYLPLSVTNITNNPQIDIKEVDKNNLKHFIELNHLENIKINHPYNKVMKKYYTYFYKQENTTLYLAYLNKRPVGTLILSETRNFIEIKELLTNHADRKRGVASSLIKFSANKAILNQKKLFVVADSEDTPRLMYENMGFKFLETKINARKHLI